MVGLSDCLSNMGSLVDMGGKLSNVRWGSVLDHVGLGVNCGRWTFWLFAVFRCYPLHYLQLDCRRSASSICFSGSWLVAPTANGLPPLGVAKVGVNIDIG